VRVLNRSTRLQLLLIWYCSFKGFYRVKCGVMVVWCWHEKDYDCVVIQNRRFREWMERGETVVAVFFF
jgi:hypothetical protein